MSKRTYCIECHDCLHELPCPHHPNQSSPTVERPSEEETYDFCGFCGEVQQMIGRRCTECGTVAPSPAAETPDERTDPAEARGGDDSGRAGIASPQDLSVDLAPARSTARERAHDDDGLTTPDGYRRVEAWTNGRRVVICSQKAWPLGMDDEAHNCDGAGCGSFSHVIADGELTLYVSEAAKEEPSR